eukprot:5418893-Prymnesium_polylepis.1
MPASSSAALLAARPGFLSHRIARDIARPPSQKKNARHIGLQLALPGARHPEDSSASRHWSKETLYQKTSIYTNYLGRIVPPSSQLAQRLVRGPANPKSPVRA